jgi:hypothetical protein
MENSEKKNELNMFVNIIPDFVRLVLSLLRNYDLSQFKPVNHPGIPGLISSIGNGINFLILESKAKDDSLLKDIYLCLIKCINSLKSNKDLMKEIFDFIGSKEVTKKYFEIYLKETNSAECKYFVI